MTAWKRMRRGRGTVDATTGHWKQTWGPWHLLVADGTVPGGWSAVAACGTGTYRAWPSDASRIEGDRPPDGQKVCAKCLRIAAENERGGVR